MLKSKKHRNSLLIDSWHYDHYKKMRKRASKSSRSEIFTWADNAITDMGWNLQDYRKTDNADSLHEVIRTIITMQAAIDELISDHEARNKL